MSTAVDTTRTRPATLRRIWAHPGVRRALFALAVIGLFAAVGPLATGHDRDASDFVRGVAGDLPAPPSAAHWLGTDRLFRDQFTRLACATRLSLTIASIASGAAAALGTIVGVLAAMLQGRFVLRVPLVGALCIGLTLVLLGRTAGWVVATTFAVGLFAIAIGYLRHSKLRPAMAGSEVLVDADAALMWLVDVGLSFPFLLAVMALAATFERTTSASLCVTLALSGWLGTARLARARTLSIRNADYLTAAQALGAGFWRLVWVHVLPQLLPFIIAVTSLGAAQMIVAECVLSYLGAGVSPPTPTLGHMIYEGQEVYLACPWLLIAPSCVMLLGVFALNRLGEGVRDAIE
jgi:ABC-type dipeptide/oligopeptide/nickel transport system permease subunit